MALTKIGTLGIADDAITAAKLPANSVDSSELVNGSVDLAHMSADSVDGTKIADDSIDSEHYAAGSIDNAHLAVNSVDSDQYVDGSIDNAHLAANSVDSDQYVDGSIDTDHIAANAVDGTKIAMGSDAAGDVLTYTGTDYVRLAKGTAGQALIMNGGATAVEWGSAGASLSSAQSWTGPQRGTPSTVTNGTLDLDTANNFLYTPAAADVLEFSNETAGQAGFITLINPSAYTISLGSEVKKGASWDVSTAGTYLVSYYSDGTSVYVSASEALS